MGPNGNGYRTTTELGSCQAPGLAEQAALPSAVAKEAILAMQPGTTLNAKVAEKIMGHVVVEDALFGCMERLEDKEGESVWGPPWPYSEDMETAELVVDRMMELGYEDAMYWADFGGGKYSEPEAICKAALLALEGGIVECC